MTELKPCGTTAAYQRHRKRKETACDDCKAAVAAYNRAYRAANPQIAVQQREGNQIRDEAVKRLISRHFPEFRQIREVVRREFRTGAWMP